MARDASKEDHLGRNVLAGPLKSVSTKLLVRWLVIVLCLLFWVVLLFVFVL